MRAAGRVGAVLAAMVATLAGATTPAGSEPVPGLAERFVVGEEREVGVAAPMDGRWRVVDVTGLPPGAELHPGRGSVTWRPGPDDVGEVTVEVLAVDERGRWLDRDLTLPVRVRDPQPVYLAMGDSIPSGHGLDRTDYLLTDNCWRDRGESYPGHVADRLPDLDLRLVACSGAYLDDLAEQSVTGGPRDLLGSRSATQLEWATAANPEVITLTIGANDLGFLHPERLLDDGEVDTTELSRRLAGVAAGLDDVLDHLTTTTDATVVVTTYHDPTAVDPHGVSGCERTCFAAAARTVVDAFDDTIVEVAAAHEGVVVADVRDRFDGHGAPNGRGPDGVRAGKGFLGWLIPSPTRGIAPYCSKGPHDNDTWVSAADCIHPNGEGQVAYAETVVEALEEAGVAVAPEGAAG